MVVHAQTTSEIILYQPFNNIINLLVCTILPFPNFKNSTFPFGHNKVWKGSEERSSTWSDRRRIPLECVAEPSLHFPTDSDQTTLCSPYAGLVTW